MLLLLISVFDISQALGRDDQARRIANGEGGHRLGVGGIVAAFGVGGRCFKLGLAPTRGRKVGTRDNGHSTRVYSR